MLLIAFLLMISADEDVAHHSRYDREMEHSGVRRHPDRNKDYFFNSGRSRYYDSYDDDDDDVKWRGDRVDDD